MATASDDLQRNLRHVLYVLLERTEMPVSDPLHLTWVPVDGRLHEYRATIGGAHFSMSDNDGGKALVIFDAAGRRLAEAGDWQRVVGPVDRQMIRELWQRAEAEWAVNGAAYRDASSATVLADLGIDAGAVVERPWEHRVPSTSRERTGRRL